MKEKTKNKMYRELCKRDKVRAAYMLAKEYQESMSIKCKVEQDESGVKIIGETLHGMKELFEKMPSFCLAYSCVRDGKVVLRILVL